MYVRIRGRDGPGPLVHTEVPKDAMIYTIYNIFFLLYRDKKLKFSYVLFCEFKPFGGADN